jgi:hypothetical protein
MDKNHFQEDPFKKANMLYCIEQYVGLGFENNPFKIRG